MTPHPRGIFCNRTLNLQAVRAIGYDMDYTLIHYTVEEWEQRAFEYLRGKLSDIGWPVGHLKYAPNFVIRGLIVDRELGNIVKANRFGYIKRAYHGTRQLEFDEQRSTYARTLVDLSDRRWEFLNTFFSLSAASMYAQLVDMYDRGELPGVTSYRNLNRRIHQGLDATHAEGQLKREIIEDPNRFVEIDPEVPPTLLDQREAGKRLALITNSEWFYTRDMMKLCMDPYLPPGTTWRDLFDVVIVSARKPHFFTTPQPLFELANEEGLLRPMVGGPTKKGIYLGGNAWLIEEYLRLAGNQILYVGDHLYTDVRVIKDVLRWRTALMVRELEEELRVVGEFDEKQNQLDTLMDEKEAAERELARLRLELQRSRRKNSPEPSRPRGKIEESLDAVRSRLSELDDAIAPFAIEAGKLFNESWGLLMRTGADKSHLARQVERYADVYTSRVSNFLHHTPFAFLRSPRGSLPHDPTTREG